VDLPFALLCEHSTIEAMAAMVDQRRLVPIGDEHVHEL
jgi:hypothetical protein